MRSEKTNDIQQEAKSLRDMLFDPDCHETITMCDNDGNEVEFEQVATIARNGNAYVMLKPLIAENIDGVEYDEIFIFALAEDEYGYDTLVMVVDNDEGESVLEEYNRLVEEAK